MRLPLTDKSVGSDYIDKMVDAFLGHGFSYFDTAYVYEGSEEALRKSLVERYPRDRFQIATKLAVMNLTGAEQQREQFDTSVRRLGVDFVDFYLLHGLSGKFIEMAYEFDSWGFIKGLKAKGLAKHIGFSFHGTPEELEDIFQKQPEMEFVQLQINYLDWENPAVQSRRLYEVARKYNKPLTIMEPAKGGLLTSEDSEAGKLLRAANPDASVASWAFRFVRELEGLIVILSGMGTLEQIEDNVNTFKSFKPLSEDEHQTILKAVDAINATPRIPCTSCRYCVPNCPQKIMIPALIGLYNDYLTYRSTVGSSHRYDALREMGLGSAGACVKCRSCEGHCPQHIEISEVLSKTAAVYE
jgi:predicted aldo/keto reductase-like oxidoreductase